jgi:YVTN family beta-propeller protein
MVAGLLAAAVVLAFAPLANAATLSNAWVAKIGSSGVNGSATLNLYVSGTGSIALKLAKLKASTSLAVTLLKTNCSGKTLLTLPSIKTSAAGAATRTTNLTVAQANSVKAATIGNARIAIRVGAGTTAKCGVFAVLPVPAYLAATVTVGPVPSGLAITPTGVWVANYYNGTIVRVDQATNSLLSSLQAGGDTENVAPDRLAYADGSLWVTSVEYDVSGATVTGHSLRRIDPVSGQIVAKIAFATYLDDIAASPGAIWVTSYSAGTVAHVDTATNQVTATVTIGPGVEGIAFGEGSVWVANETAGSVSRIDPATNTVTATIATVATPEGVAVGGGAIWVTNWGSSSLLSGDGVLSRIDPATNMVTRTIVVGTNPWWVAYGGGSVWVALHGDPTVVRVNATTGVVQGRISHVPANPVGPDARIVGVYSIAATDHAVWVDQRLPAPDSSTAPPPGTLLRINY